jgi:uncharacterized protein DUF6226
MTANYLGPEGPPDEEAYSRVTNPERFAPLHDIAAGLLNRLEATFYVERAEGYGLDPELESVELARPSTRLIPRNPGAAPIVIAFTAFPGVFVRFGRWYIDTFPGCGCNACDETAEGEASRLEELIQRLTAGHYREAILDLPDGDAWQEIEFRAPQDRISLRGLSMPPPGHRLGRAEAAGKVAAAGRSEFDWKPWESR